MWRLLHQLSRLNDTKDTACSWQAADMTGSYFWADVACPCGSVFRTEPTSVTVRHPPMVSSPLSPSGWAADNYNLSPLMSILCQAGYFFCPKHRRCILPSQSGAVLKRGMLNVGVLGIVCHEREHRGRMFLLVSPSGKRRI